MCAKQVKKPGEVPTTGHEWDGIQEYDNPMPRWWLWTFYLCIIWAIGYMIAYPAWPLVTKATNGFLGTTAAGDTRLAVAEEIEKDLFLKCSGRQPRSREGLTEGQWVLLDYGDFVIHVMHEESREFYGLERLWRDCPAIDLELAHPETAEHAEDAAVTTA